MDLKHFWKRKVFCLITGASKGYGKTLAITLSKYLGQGSKIFLISRNLEKLNSVKTLIMKENNVSVDVASIDLSKPDGILFENLFKPFQNEIYDIALLINNAGTIGDVSKDASSFYSNFEISEYYKTNVNSPIILTSTFIKIFKTAAKLIVVNISSLAALQPFKGWTLYCTGKAARDMYFRVLAAEDPDISVLNYAPGPMNTDMMEEILAHSKPEIQAWASKCREENSFVSMEHSANRLWTILAMDKYISGSHIDVFDPLP